MNRTVPRCRHDCLMTNAFTLVELLIVIGIIGLLMGLLLPALSAARRQARMVNEMAASHELIQAYTIYANEHKGQLMPGYINSFLPEFQSLVVSDKFGNALDTQAADRWPWRLASYIQYGIKGSILVNDMAPLAERGNWNTQTYPAPSWGYAVSLYPSFGLNMLNLGGDLYHASSNQARWIQKASQAKQASRLTVFATAQFSAAVPGYFEIDPPVRLQSGIVQGMPVTVANVWKPSAGFSHSKPPGHWGYVDPRWNGRAIVACLDGHSELLSLKDLCDMTRWSNAAQAAGDPNWGRPAGDPNWVP